MPDLASPLPVPAPVSPQNPLAQSLTALGRAAPNLDPAVAAGVAQGSQSPADAVVNGQAASGYILAANTGAWLRQQNRVNQQAAWGQLSSTQQQMVSAAGYRPPPKGQSLWGTITSDVGAAVSGAARAANMGLNLEHHLERTVTTVTGSQFGPAGILEHPGELLNLHYKQMGSTSDWAQAWNETSNGEHYVLPQVQRQVLDRYGQETYDLAMKLATGTKAADLIAAVPANAQQALAQRIQGDPNVGRAVAMLNAGKMSIGRSLAYRVFGMKPGSQPANILSGGTDALVDWFGDPTVIGAKGVHAARVAKYFVQTGADVMARYQTSAAVQAEFDRLAEIRQQPDWATRLEFRNPRLVPVMDVFRDWNPSTGEDVARMFADLADVNTVAAGNVPRLQSILPASLPGGMEGGVLPHLSAAGQLRLAAKGVLQRSIDWAADQGAHIPVEEGDTVASPAQGIVSRIALPVGTLARHLTTLTPTGTTFNANDPAWFSNLRDIAMQALPKTEANRLLNAYADEATLGGRRAIYTGLLKSVFMSMGIDRTPEGEQWMERFLNPESEVSPISKQHYAPGDIDAVTRGGTRTNVGILKGDMTDEWALPNFKELYAQSQKTATMRAVNGATNNQMVDQFMNGVWKPLALARFGFAVRVAGEEAFGMLLRANPMAYVHASAARSLLTHEQHLADPEWQGRLAGTAGYLVNHLPAAARARIQTPTDLAVEHLSDATQRAMAGVAGVMAGEKYRRAVRLMARHGVLDPDGAFGRYVGASESHGGQVYDQALGEMGSTRWNHGKWVTVRLSPTGAFAEYNDNTAQPFTNLWYKRLHAAAGDPWARAALEARGSDPAERLRTVAEKIAADPDWSRAERYGKTTDDRLVVDGPVGPGEASRADAARDHAHAVIGLVDSLTRRADGTEVPGLVDHMLANRRPPTVAVLDTLPHEDRPESVTGPEYLASESRLAGGFTAGIERMFSIIGKQIDWISRKPMFIHNTAVSMDAYAPHVAMMRRMGMSERDIEANLVHQAVDRAIHLTTPYIHNPEIRSQLEVIGRNVAPFMFAQEQFYKRWARTMAWAPWAFRQAQLINQGVYHSGFTHTDPATGQQYFVYPGAGAVQDVLSRALTFGGFHPFLPIEANLRGQVKMASPGLERIGPPSLGPLVVIPLNEIVNHFPELRGPAQAIEGSQAATQSYVDSLVPTQLRRIWQVVHSNPNNDSQYASAMMQAIQYLEATGHGIGTVAQNDLGSYGGAGAPPIHDGTKPGDYVTDVHGQTWVVQADGVWRRNDPGAQAQYLARVSNWTRVFMLTRAIFGFNAPASPENLFDPGHVNEDFQAMLKELPYNEAVAAFMKLHPDATAYTIFQTKNQAGAPLPATASAMQFMDANRAFFDAHPLAGAFFIPTQDTSGKFDVQAYRQQLVEQLRVRKTPDEFWKEVLYRTASGPYYQGEAAKNRALSAGGNYTAVNRAWTAQSQQYMASNPVFAQQLADRGSAYTRADIEKDLGSALSDPNLPETPQTEHIRALFNAWVSYQAEVAPYSAPGGGTLSSQQRYQLMVGFARDSAVFVQAHPDTQTLFDRLMRPALSSVLNQTAAAV